jgi:helix-turn-helix protein
MEIEVEELDGVYETTIASAFNRRVSKHLVMVVTIRDGVAVSNTRLMERRLMC